MSKFVFDEAGWRLLTAEASGPTGKMMRRTIDAIRDDVIDRQRSRIGVHVYRTTAGMTRTTRGLVGTVTMRRTRPHVIVPRRASRLVFVPRGEAHVVFARRVNHPGSTPPAHYLLEAARRVRLRS